MFVLKPDYPHLALLSGLLGAATALLALPGVESVHDLHLWSLDGESHVMTLHVVSGAGDTHALRHAVVELARGERIGHGTVEFERPGTVCETDCDRA